PRESSQSYLHTTTTPSALFFLVLDILRLYVFFFTDPPTTEIYTLSLHDALPISVVDNLLDQDPFLLLADYQAYIDAQERVTALWRKPKAWTRSSILNAARMGKFSSDRSIRDYCERVWDIKPGQ